MKINIAKIEEVNAAVALAAGKARQHVHTAAQINSDASRLHEKLCRHLPKKLLVGTVLKLSSQPSLPKAYGNRKVVHTTVEVEVCPSGLFVVDIGRHESWATTTPYGGAHAVLPLAVKDHLKNILYLEAVRL